MKFLSLYILITSFFSIFSLITTERQIRKVYISLKESIIQVVQYRQYYTEKELRREIMNDKNEKDRDIFRKKFNDEFRRVRFYTNINGVRKEYGYDYNRDSEGKENYREIGEIPEEFGTEYIERILNLNRSFDWDSDLFTSSFERFAELIPSFEKIFSGKMNPQLTSGAKRETRILNQEAKNPHQVTYDLQVDKEKNQLYLIVELPGFIKEQVKLKLVKNHLELFAENSKKKIDTKIPIEQEIDKKQKIEATLRNGILEVKLKTVSEVNSDEKNISIN